MVCPIPKQKGEIVVQIFTHAGPIAACILTVFVVGCAGPSAIYDKPESHFAFPNSNVSTLGQVRSTVTKTSIMFPSVGDPDVEQDAVRKALDQKGGDMLIDGRYFWTSRYVAFLVPIYTTTLTVDGEAAKISEIGRHPRQPILEESNNP